MKNRKLLYWLIGIIVAFFVVKGLIRCVITLNESDFYSEALKEEYMSLFPRWEQKKLSSVWNYNSKVRNQFSLFDYGKEKKYCITVYKIPIGKDFLMKDISFDRTDKEKLRISSPYNIINEGLYYELDYKGGKPPIADSIKFLYVGDSAQAIIQNDSMASFYLRFKYISISYNNEGTTDIVAKTESAWANTLPLNVLLLKRKDSFYLLLMSVNDGTQSMPRDYLYKILSGKNVKDNEILLKDTLK